VGKKVFEAEAVCSSCNGIGLYRGIAEADGASVVCHTCNGTGCEKIHIEYTTFEKRKSTTMIRRVHQVNPGIKVNAEERFGGISYKDWVEGKGFPPGSEMRGFTCPAWWYRLANTRVEPKWKECIPFGSYSNCDHFNCKDRCWKKWDETFGKRKAKKNP